LPFSCIPLVACCLLLTAGGLLAGAPGIISSTGEGSSSAGGGTAGAGLSGVRGLSRVELESVFVPENFPEPESAFEGAPNSDVGAA
jgi:hypothetical protein